MKVARKNRFKKENTVRRKRLRQRVAIALRTVAGALVLAAVSTGFIFVHDYFTQSPQFRAQRITVSGNQRLTRDQVLTAAGVDLRTNILSLNLTTTRKRLLAQPWIADAVVSRQIPSGVSITVREQQPLAVLEMADGGGYLLNVDGEVFMRQADPIDETLPRVHGLGPADLPVSGRSDSEAYRALMTLLRLTREENSPLPFAELRRVWMDREIGATAYIADADRAIKLGFGQYREKYAALRYLSARLKRDSRLARCRMIVLFDVNRIVITVAPANPSDSDPEEVEGA